MKKDETLRQALYREVFEETGLEIDEIKRYIGYFDFYSKGGKLTRQFNFHVTVRDSSNIKISEHISYAWIPISKVSKYPITDQVKKILNNL